MQSPIDLLHERVEVGSHLGRLERKYKPASATVVNRGHDIMVRTLDQYVGDPNYANYVCLFEFVCNKDGNFVHKQVKWKEGAGVIYLNGTAYTLKQRHWRSPSEHSINVHRKQKYCCMKVLKHVDSLVDKEHAEAEQGW